jgi:hypothetical protein
VFPEVAGAWTGHPVHAPLLVDRRGYCIAMAIRQGSPYRFSRGARPWKNGGNVPTTPTANRSALAATTGANATSRRRHARCRPNHDVKKAPVATPALPVNGPAGGHQFRAFAISGEASAKDVITPSAAQPNPLAMMAAASGPFGPEAGIVSGAINSSFFAK